MEKQERHPARHFADVIGKGLPIGFRSFPSVESYRLRLKHYFRPEFVYDRDRDLLSIMSRNEQIHVMPKEGVHKEHGGIEVNQFVYFENLSDLVAYRAIRFSNLMDCLTEYILGLQTGGSPEIGRAHV